MASLNVHLAIGKLYLEKNKNISNEEEYYKGIIAPDLVEDKNKSHYTEYLDKSNLKFYLTNRINLLKYLKENNIDTDYELGIYIHLVTDYLFFTNFFDKSYIESVDIHKFNNDLYHSYDNIDNYLVDKYKLNFPELDEIMTEVKEKCRKKKNTKYENGKDILPFEKIDSFITYVSNINMLEYKNKIINNNKNILPD